MLGHDNTDSERKKECTKEVLINVYHTAEQLQKIHDTFWKDRQIIISSGWRSVRNNKKCGGALNSRHLYGQAIDFNLGLSTINKDYETMKENWKGFVLHEGTWIHADIRQYSKN
ncbi:MAG: D-Ala-D-Ala carboxypeptidase family metallohydrolase [Candidatus Gastranaerophilaceae bacterium]|nr:D-Ala-D-Ala carboxypeptidase family metallohydrolase [Candidatus Gastranaerophilaceae bacterium]